MLKEILTKLETSLDEQVKEKGLDEDRAEAIKRKTRESTIEKLKGPEMIKKISNRDTSLGDSPLDKSSKQYILRKGLTVERYYDQVLKPLLEEMDKELTLSVDNVVDREGIRLPALPTFKKGEDDFSKLKKLNKFLENNKGTMQKGGDWDSTNVSNGVETFYNLPTKNPLTNKNNIQYKLDKCQDLEVLYAIKHFEFMEILKPITYFLDTLSKNMVLYIFILQLYTRASQIGPIVFKEDSAIVIEKAKSIINNITTFIDSQQNIIGKITNKQEGIAANNNEKKSAAEAKLEVKPEGAAAGPAEAEAEPVADPEAGPADPEAAAEEVKPEGAAEPADLEAEAAAQGEERTGGEGEGAAQGEERTGGEGEGEEADPEAEAEAEPGAAETQGGGTRKRSNKRRQNRKSVKRTKNTRKRSLRNRKRNSSKTQKRK
jgi:hypothetical protein